MALHKKLQDLKDRVAGEYHAARYAVDAAPDYKVDVVEDDKDKGLWIIKGYLAVFGVVDSYGTRAIKGCFAKSIRERGPDSNAKNKIIHLYYHKMDEPIGQYRVLKEDNYGLYFEAVIDQVFGGRAEQTYIQTKSGTLNQFSYGFDYVWDKMEYNDKDECIDMFECCLWEGTSLAMRAACIETYAIRSKEEFAQRCNEIAQDAEALINTLPRKNQMEIRQLITSYKSLLEAKPVEAVRTLDLSYPEPKQGEVLVVDEYKIDLTKF